MLYHCTVEMCDMHSHGIDSKVIETMGLEKEYKLFIGGKPFHSMAGPGVVSTMVRSTRAPLW